MNCRADAVYTNRGKVRRAGQRLSDSPFVVGMSSIRGLSSYGREGVPDFGLPLGGGKQVEY